MTFIIPTFSENRLNIFRAMCHGASSISIIARSTGLSEITVQRAVHQMHDLDLVLTHRERPIRIEPPPTGQAVAPRPPIIPEKSPLTAIIGAKLLVLLSLLSAPKDLERISMETRLKRETVRVLTWKLRTLGALSTDGDSVFISPGYQALSKFLTGFSAGVNDRAMKGLVKDGVMLWTGGLEFIFASKTDPVPASVRLTGPSAMTSHGVELISSQRYYHCSYWDEEPGVEDIAIHNILIDPHSARGIGHSILLLKKAGYDRGQLLKTSAYAGIQDTVSAAIDRMEGRPSNHPFLPNEAELKELFRQYGVL